MRDRSRPAILYKYVAVESWLPLMLSGDSLLFSSRKTFNDPFDSKPAFRVSNSEGGRKYIKDVFQRRLSKMPPAKRLQAIRQAENVSRKGAIAPTEQSDKLLDEIGILCLSAEWNNVLLWSHYANHHKGICIGFRADSDVFQLAREVRYQNERPVICRPDDDLDTIINKTFFTKATCWDYEKEWRITKPKLTQQEKDLHFGPLWSKDYPKDFLKLMNEQDGAKVYRFDPRTIESITCGLRMSENDRSIVIAALQTSNLDIPLYNGVQTSTEYTVNRTMIRYGHTRGNS